MDHKLFCAVLKNLLHVNIHAGDLDENFLRLLEEKYCFHPALQPLFKAEVLQPLLQKIEPGVLYEFRDRLGVCVLFFVLDGVPMNVGPFVRREFDLDRTRRLMLEAGLPGSYAESIRLYYSNFPLCGMTRAIDAILACYRAFLPEAPSLNLARIDDYPETRKLPKQNYEERLDYSSVYRRYALENEFLHYIEKGEPENTLAAHDRMAAEGLRDKRYVNAVYQDVNVSFAILRGLARKAAENGGASVVEINEITQRSIQQMQAEQSVQKKVQISRAMYAELAQAVDKAHSRTGSFSPVIRKAVDILRHNYSQNLSMEQLAEQVRLSPSHLSHLFSKEVGMSVSQYVAALRCEEAASLLKTSGAPVSEISAYVGYLDQNYFVKVFKKHYNKTPSEFRAESNGNKAE